MKMDRRAFLKVAAGGTLGLLAPRPAGAADPGPAAPGPFDLVPLGRTGLKVSRIGFGTGMRGWMRETNQTRLGAEAFEALLKAGYERGIRLFDLADLYGTHPYLARALKGLPRQGHVLVTKMWVKPGGIPEKERPDADVLVDRFRKELATDYLDLVLLHCQTSPDWPKEQKRYMDKMADLKAKGVIRAHGVSCHSLAALAAAAACPWVDSVHARINHAGTAMDGPPEKVAPVLRKLHDAGKGVIGMKLVGEGRFRDDPAKRDESIRYVLGLGSVDAMVVGFEKAGEMDDFSGRVAAALGARASA